jgi:hypothetical protein
MADPPMTSDSLEVPFGRPGATSRLGFSVTALSLPELLTREDSCFV